MSNIAQRVIEQRKKLGMSQKELAHEAEMSLKTIKAIEKGAVEPSACELVFLANALGLMVNELLHEDIRDWPIYHEVLTFPHE